MEVKQKIATYVLLFIAGVWGGSQLVDRFSNSDNKIAKAPLAEAHLSFKTSVSDFSLPDTEGVFHQFSEWQGKVRVLNFWATWCPPCVKETPMFVELQEQYADRGLQFIGVGIDDLEKIRNFIDTYGVNYPTLVGESKAYEVSKLYGNKLGILPYTVVINQAGTIVHAQGGEFTREQAKRIIPPLLLP